MMCKMAALERLHSNFYQLPTMIIRSLLVAISIFAPLTAQSQASGAPEQPPQIVVSSRGEVKVTPDRATVQMSVQTRGPTAAGAATENATKQKAVLDALRRLGLSNDQLSTINFQVNPEYRYEQNKEPAIIGYVVTNTILAEVRQISQTGAVIDAGLANGSNMISSLDFHASNVEGARRTAIASAIQKARADAEAAARAAGGSLGTLLELNIGAYYPPGPRPMMMRASKEAMAADTPMNPGQESVTVEVSTRWRFLPSS